MRNHHSTRSRLGLAAALLLLTAAPARALLGADYFPNVPLVNQDGKVLHFYDDVIKGKVVAINFMFTSCGDSCPLATAKLRKLQRLLGDHVGRDVYMYSISIDPDRDTPEVLKRYMERFHVGPGWQFLRGRKEDVDLIRKKLGMYSYDEQDISDHNINFICGNEATGQWVKRTPFDVPQSLVALLLGRLQNRPLPEARLAAAESRSYRLPQATGGEEVFRSRCSACHTIGGGDDLGPDLRGVVQRRARGWLKRFLKHPDRMLESDPLAKSLLARFNGVRMPDLKLNDATIDSLLDYIDREGRRLAASGGRLTEAGPVRGR